MTKCKLILGYFVVLLFFVGCKSDTGSKTTNAELPLVENGYEVIQKLFLDAKSGETIKIPEGRYLLNRALSLEGLKNINIVGDGVDKTVLSFLDQKTGAEGIRITADSVSLKGFTIEDAVGDGIKFQDCHVLHVEHVNATWTQGAKETNGGYGLYPVQCEDVTIKECEVSYASDAGIYVGQSKRIVVHNNIVHHNVAGIEIENCVGSKVYDNLAENNTAGILVFDLPDLELVNGSDCKVYNNKIVGNNFKNFAAEGNIVAIAPPGSGMILLAAKDVEIYDNEILDHKTLGIGISSYQLTERTWKDERYDPFTHDVVIRNNKFDRKSTIPDLTKKFGKMINYYFKAKPQDIIYDGILPDGVTSKNPQNICVKGNTSEKPLRFATLDAANDFKGLNDDISIYACE